MKKKVLNIDELTAKQSLYTGSITKKHIVMMLLIPGLYIGFMLYITFFRWWLIIVGLTFGMIYSLVVIIPMSIEMSYKRASFRERNRFINNMTQALHRKNATIPSALSDVSDYRLKGELKNDIEVLVAHIDGKEEVGRQQAYNMLIDKYADDRIFVQYIEHLMTLDFNGKTNLSALDETAEAHDLSLQQQEKLIEAKFEKMTYYILVSILSVVLCVFSIYIVWENHIEIFAHSIIGRIFGGIYLLIHFFYNHKAIKDFSDEEVMKVRF